MSTQCVVRLSIFQRLGLIVGVCVIGALWLIWKGPVPVLRGTTPLPEITPFWYMESAFVALGIILCDLVEEMRAGWLRVPAIVLVVQIVLLVAISSLRLDSRIPLSGHSALFTFLVLRTLVHKSKIANPITRIEVIVGVTLLIVVSYIKVVWWHDWLSLTMGMVFGIVVDLAGTALRTMYGTKT